MTEKFYWADQIADQIIKKNPRKKVYTCASGTGLSGTVHIGNFRDVITTELVIRALRDKGKKTRFIYSWDDFDRFRKVPANIPKSYEKYIGMSVSDFPSPFSKKKSYARFLEGQFEGQLPKVGVKPEFIQQSIMNKKCKYADLIKIAIDKRKEIIKILNKYRKEPLAKDWYPIMVFCEKCKKDSTKIISAKGYEVEYECKCGHKDKIDIRKKGIVKAPWRVDWPMRWFYEKVDFEPGGIDLSVKGGSFTTGREIVKEIYEYDSPMYVFYDWIKIKGGAEFSGSSGNALTINDVLEIYEPELLRYLFVGTKPKTGFQISFDNDVIKIYEDYDKLETKYYEKKVNKWEKRIYELSQVGKISKKKSEKSSFRHLINLIQTGKKIEAKDKARAERVKNWLEKYAEEDMKFEVQTKIQIKLTAKEKKAMMRLKSVLNGKKKHTEKELFNNFYEISQEIGMTNTEFFNAAYRVIINKSKGPRLATLILTTGVDKIIKLLNQAK